MKALKFTISVHDICHVLFFASFPVSKSQEKSFYILKHVNVSYGYLSDTMTLPQNKVSVS